MGHSWIRLDKIGKNWIRLVEKIGNDWIKLNTIGKDWMNRIRLIGDYFWLMALIVYMSCY